MHRGLGFLMMTHDFPPLGSARFPTEPGHLSSARRRTAAFLHYGPGVQSQSDKRRFPAASRFHRSAMHRRRFRIAATACSAAYRNASAVAQPAAGPAAAPGSDPALNNAWRWPGEQPHAQHRAEGKTENHKQQLAEEINELERCRIFILRPPSAQGSAPLSPLPFAIAAAAADPCSSKRIGSGSR